MNEHGTKKINTNTHIQTHTYKIQIDKHTHTKPALLQTNYVGISGTKNRWLEC